MERRGSLVVRVALHPAVRWTVAALVVAAGLAAVVLAFAVGHCSFVGGRCPGEPVPWWDNEVFGASAAGVAMVVGAPMVAWRPTRRGVARAALAVAVAAPVVGWLVTEAARTGA